MPPDVNLGVGGEVLARHVACDIGAGPLARLLARRLAAPSWIARWSRLVCDLNRSPEPGLIAPAMADGDVIAGNRHLTPAAIGRRLAIHSDFHEHLAARVTAQKPAMLLAVHSFTPHLRVGGTPRPWPIGILWNRDHRAADRAIPLLEKIPAITGPVGANKPYSGQVLNYTMNRHAEANGLPYLVVEIRQDLLATPAAVAGWSDVLLPVVKALLAEFAGSRAPHLAAG